VTQDGSYQVFESNSYNMKGFLLKNFTVSAIISDGVKPTLTELTKFEDQPDTLTLDCEYCS